jgi:hypothetical protein
LAATRAKTVGKKKKGAKPSKRSYSFKTIKVLFGLAGNRCAVPGCPNPIITPGTTLSEDAVIGQICHIYAVSDAGPRGKLGLTEAEKNSAANLILCCPTHHAVIDKQYDDYPAATLIDWKRSQERAYRTRLASSISSIGYAELEVTAKALMSHQAPSASDTVVIPNESLFRAVGISAYAQAFCCV